MRMRILILRPDEIMANTFTDGCLSSIIYQDLKRHLNERVKHLLELPQNIMQIGYEAQSAYSVVLYLYRKSFIAMLDIVLHLFFS